MKLFSLSINFEFLQKVCIYSTLPLSMRAFTVTVTEVTPFGFTQSPFWSYSSRSPCPPLSSMHFRQLTWSMWCFRKDHKAKLHLSDRFATRLDVSGRRRHFPVARVQPQNPAPQLCLWAELENERAALTACGGCKFGLELQCVCVCVWLSNTESKVEPSVQHWIEETHTRRQREIKWINEYSKQLSCCERYDKWFSTPVKCVIIVFQIWTTRWGNKSGRKREGVAWKIHYM